LAAYCGALRPSPPLPLPLLVRAGTGRGLRGVAALARLDSPLLPLVSNPSILSGILLVLGFGDHFVAAADLFAHVRFGLDTPSLSTRGTGAVYRAKKLGGGVFI
jgi:hypothetical protein